MSDKPPTTIAGLSRTADRLFGAINIDGEDIPPIVTVTFQRATRKHPALWTVRLTIVPDTVVISVGCEGTSQRQALELAYRETIRHWRALCAVTDQSSVTDLDGITAEDHVRAVAHERERYENILREGLSL